MMKKCLAVLLLLCLLLPCAQAAGVLEIVEKRVVRQIEDSSAEVNVYVVVKNTGDAPAGLDEGSVVFVDGQGAELFDESAYSLYPSTLNPGETGYLTIWCYGADQAKAQAIASYTLTVETEEDPRYAVTRLPFTAEYKCVTDGYFEEYYVEFSVTNNTPDTIWEPVFYTVLRDETGKIFSMDETQAYGLGIPAGATVYFRTDVDYDAEKYIEKGHTPTAECVVYLEAY